MNKKIEAIWAVLCAGTSTDRISNNISLFNVIEQVNIEVSPEDLKKAEKDSAHIEYPFECVLLLRSDDFIESFSGKIELLDPNNKKLLSVPFKSPPTSERKKRYRLTLQMNGIRTFGVSGYYQVKVSIEDKKLCSVPFELIITKSAALEAK